MTEPIAPKQDAASGRGSADGGCVRPLPGLWRGWPAAVVVAVLVAAAPGVQAGTAHRLVRQGNEAFAAGDYAAALRAYGEADVELPESPVVQFNRGTVHYRRDEFPEAREAFTRAMERSPDTGFEADCRYNIGNTWFREARRQQESDPGKALEACEKAIDSYQGALALNPDLPDAKTNIEVARRLWKAILDAQQQRAQQQAEQQQAAQELQNLIRRQEEAAAGSRALAERQSAMPEGEAEAAATQLSEAQEAIGKETDELMRKLEQMAASQAAQQAPPGSSPPGGAPTDHGFAGKENIERARGHQDTAAAELAQTRPEPAADEQEQAAEELRRALESMTSQEPGQPQPAQGSQPENQQEQGERQEGQDQTGQQQGEDEQEKQQSGDEQKQQQGEKQDGQEEESQEQQAQAADASQAETESSPPATLADRDARDILDQERRDREQRRALHQNAIRPVDKDW